MIGTIASGLTSSLLEGIKNWLAQSQVGTLVAGYTPSLILLFLMTILPHILYCTSGAARRGSSFANVRPSFSPRARGGCDRYDLARVLRNDLIAESMGHDQDVFVPVDGSVGATEPCSHVAGVAHWPAIG